MGKHIMNNKTIINITLNFILFIILLYFSNVNQLITSLSKVNISLLIVGILLSILFTIMVALRWENFLKSRTTKRNRLSFIIASHKKEFYASFTSNIVGDIYSIFKINGVPKKYLTHSLLITKFFDFIVVFIFSIVSIILMGYLDLKIGLFLILISLISLLLINLFISYGLGIIKSINKKIKFKFLEKLELLSSQKLNRSNVLGLLSFTILIWLIRLGITFITFTALNYQISLPWLLFITFVPIIASLIVFILPKSISGDSTTVALGVLIGINYNILLGYVIIYRIYSLVIAIVGILLDSFRGKMKA